MAKLGSYLFIFLLSLYHFLICKAVGRKNITTDESALLAFKSSMTDPYLLANNWSTSFSSSPCNWVGVTCDNHHGRVKALNLTNMGLHGTISPELGNLSFLVFLDLHGNTLYGELPQELFLLRRLKWLDLSQNEFRGEIKAQIGDLSKLQYLNIGQNNITGFIPQSISNLSKLEYFICSLNFIMGTIPPHIGYLTQLKTLDVGSNTLSGIIPSTISNLSSVEYISLFANSLSGEIPLSFFNISSLRKANLAKNNLSGSLPQTLTMCLLPQLEAFSVGFNQIEGSITRSISNCTSLINLFLGNNLLTGSIPSEIGNLKQIEILALGYNYFSGPIPSKVFNISTLRYLYLAENSLSGTLPLDMGNRLPNLEELHLYGNRLVGNLPNGISNASMLTVIDIGENGFSGNIPNVFGGLTFLRTLALNSNHLKTDDSLEFILFTSLTSCRHLKHLVLYINDHLPNLPRSIGNFSHSLEYLWADYSTVHGNIPPEIGNISSLLYLSLSGNELNGSIPPTVKGLQKLQYLTLAHNALVGPVVDELCGITSLSVLYLTDNRLSGELPTCLENMTSLRKLDLGLNKFISGIPSSFWNLKDILEINLSSNALSGNLSSEIGQMRAIILLDLSKNSFSGSIPQTIGLLKTLQNLSLADNRLEGFIPELIGQMVSLNMLDLSHNSLSGVIPKSLESLPDLQFINFSYNRLEGEIPNGGHFINFTAQSFMHNKALCGNNPILNVTPCAQQVRRRRLDTKLILLKCILPIIMSIFLVVAFIVFFLHKRKNAKKPLERNLSTLGVLRRVSYYELVQATNGFSESNLLGKGSFGSVYQGMLSDGLIVAIKVFHVDLESVSRSFETECSAMCHLRHRNLVKIISSCSNGDFKSLVIEFMSNGSLDKWLYSHNYCLDFLQRLNVMIDVASALEYLHHGFLIPVVHCDLKPSNILLDENMVAQVSDFGIAKLLSEGQSKTHTQTLATFGYIAPEYGSKGIISVKGDVYSYGILLMETFTRKKPIDDMFASGLSLKSWVNESISNSLTEVVDSNLIQGYGEQFDKILAHISSILILALDCCAESPEARTDMINVTASLAKIKTLVIQE